MKTPIINHKEVCRELAPIGWSYTGFDDGFYCFQTGNYSTGFKEMKCKQEDLTNANLALMVRLNMTRV
jgi:hypothetical protein